MKNKILWLFVIAVTGICCLFAACKSQETPSLNAPENVRVENGFLVWDKVENAEKYVVYYNNKEHETVNNFFDLATISEVGEYLIEILAVGDGNKWTDSSWSTYNYTLNHIDDTPTIPSQPTENLSFSLLEDKSGYEVSKGTANLTGTIVIPSTHNGLPVKQIAEKAFSYFQGLHVTPNTRTTAVIMPDTIETISSYAFTKCTALKYVKIPQNLVCISISAFMECTSLQKITLNEGLVKIEQNAFQGASNLKEFNLPSTLTTLQSNAFTDTAWLNESPDGDVVKDGIYVRHKGTSGDTLNVTGCRLIADEALLGKHFTEVTISDGIAIGNKVLAGTQQLRKVTLPKDLKKLPYATFYGSAIQTIQLPEGLTEIGEGAFFNSGLTEIELPSSLKKICNQAFQQSKLTNIYIPSGVEIDTNAFNSCALLESVIIQGSEKIFDDAFYSCQKLLTVNLLGKTVDIGAEAFRNCIALEHLQLPENLQTIGNDCFKNCKKLTKVKFPDSLKTIGKNAFDSTGLESLTLNSNLEEIQDSAFNKCEALTVIDFANCKAKINSTAFSNTGVTEITIPDYVNFDDSSAGFFSNCAKLKKATIGALKKIPDGIFRQCTALENVVFSEGITEIGQGAFSNCQSITDLQFPTTLETINTTAFSRCIGLTRVTFPENLTSVSNGFLNCTNLTEVVLNKNIVPAIADFLKKTASITKIYFYGQKSDWDNCSPKDYTLPESVTLYFYTDNDTAPIDGNRYWHYLSDKDIEILN